MAAQGLGLMHSTEKIFTAGQWWRTPLTPALRRQRQADLSEFEASLVYRVGSRTGSKATDKPCLWGGEVIVTSLY